VKLVRQANREESDEDEENAFMKLSSDNSDSDSQEDDNSVFEKRLIFQKEGS